MPSSVDPGGFSSLAWRFAVAAALLAGCATLLVSGVSWWWVDSLQHDAAERLRESEARLRAAAVADALAVVLERMQEIAASPLVSTALTDSAGRDSYLQPYVAGVQSLNGVPLELLVLDAQGTEIARNGDVGFTPGQQKRLLAALREGRPEAFTDGPPGQETLLLSTVVRYPRSGTAEGAVWVRLPLDRLLAWPGYRLHAGPASPVGAAVAPGAEREVPVTLAGALAPLQLTVHQLPAPAVHLHGGTFWAGMAGAAALLMLGLGWAGWRVARRLTAELADLDRFANQMAGQEGGLARAPVRGPREVAGLAQSINRMLDGLQARHAQLSAEAQAQLTLLATCIEHLNDMVLITEAEVDPEHGHRLVFVNSAFERLTGYPRAEVLGRDPRLLQCDQTDRAELKRVGEHLRRWEPVRTELVNRARDGRLYRVEMEIVPVRRADGWVTHWVAVERDVTARREAEQRQQDLEQQVREAQKMEAIGTLAGGIAHDFNNILGAVLGSVALARDELPSGHPVQQHLQQIDRSAARARSLVRKILAYSRRQEQQRSAQDLQALVDDAVALLRATVPASVALECVPAGRPVMVLGDATELTQVLINLGTNAWQALQGRPGHVRFGLGVEEGAGASPRAQAHLWVQDDGCGMDAETQQRVFEPFFTTKPVGTGTGLGLSVVQGIVRAHGGTLAIDSAPGAGSTFHIRLPLLAVPAATQAAPAAPASAPRGRGQRVMYVDDDAVMATVVGALLQRWGYTVTALDDATAALRTLREDPQAVELVVTDFNMPGLSGLELTRELRRLRPTLPVLMTSGYISDETRERVMEAGAAALLHKENLQDELAQAVSAALERRPG